MFDFVLLHVYFLLGHCCTGSTFFMLKYETDVGQGRRSTVVDLPTLGDNLMKQWQITGITVYSAQFISSSSPENTINMRLLTKTNDAQYQKNERTKGDTLIVLLSIENPPNCISTTCINHFLSQVNNTMASTHQNMELTIAFTSGQMINAQLTCSSTERISRDQISAVLPNEPTDERKFHKHKRQGSVSGEPTTQTAPAESVQSTQPTATASDASTPSTAQNASGSDALINLSQPIFFPQAVVIFQLALKSNKSIVVIIGNDQNLYLSAQYLAGTTASNFSLIDLDLPAKNRTYTALIQDAQTQRYLHTYNDIQEKTYSRVRTNLDSYMPCSANIMFWTFVRGYLQFYRGGFWFYDTAGCVDSTTNLVRLWLVNGQQGLTALQAQYGRCGLARLVAINYELAPNVTFPTTSTASSATTVSIGSSVAA